MKKYLLSLLLGASVLLSALGTFSWYVDPFCFFERNTYGMYWHTERYCKEYYVKKYPDYNLILIGNSRVAWIDADRPKAINASFSGANIREIYEFLEKHLAQNKTVYLGLDFEQLYQHDENFDDKSVFHRNIFDYMHHLFSFEIISKSFANHFLRRNFDPSIPLHIQKGNREWKNSDDVKLKALQDIVESGDNIVANEEYQKESLTDQKVSQKIEYLSRIKTVLESREARYAVFINPIMPERLRQLRQNQHENVALMEKFPSVVRNVFPEVLDISITHPFPNSKFRDVSHYTPEVGGEILKIIESK